MDLRQRLRLGHVALALVVLGVGLVALVVIGRAAPALENTPEAIAFLRRARGILIAATVLGLAAVAALGWQTLRALRRSLDRLEAAAYRLRTDALDASLPASEDPAFQPLFEALEAMTGALRQQTVPRAHLHHIIDSMAEMLVVVGSDGRIQMTNRAAGRTLGYDANTLRDLPLRRLIATDDRDSGDVLPSPPVEQDECTLQRRDGTTLPVLFSCAALQGSTPSDSERIVCVAQDITERKAADERLRASLHEKEVLLREIHHRVKNNLQVISSLLALQADGLEDDAHRLIDESQRRIRSMALVHERLYRSDDLAQIDFGDYLTHLCDQLARSYGAGHIDLTVDVQARPLDVDRAIPVGLITNELIANALEHAFPGGQSGSIALRFSMRENTGTLVVEDDGAGLPNGVEQADLEAGDSLGLKLVHALVGQLGGTLEIEDKGRTEHGADGIQQKSGLRFTITFPCKSSSEPSTNEHPAHE